MKISNEKSEVAFLLDQDPILQFGLTLTSTLNYLAIIISEGEVKSFQDSSTLHHIITGLLREAPR